MKLEQVLCTNVVHILNKTLLSITNNTTLMLSLIILVFFDSYIKYGNKMCGQKPGLLMLIKVAHIATTWFLLLL
jgi:hypothetical protein